MQIMNGRATAYSSINFHFYVNTFVLFEWLRMQIMNERATEYSSSNISLCNQSFHYLYDSECKSWMDVQLHILEVMFHCVTNFLSFLWLRMQIMNGHATAYSWNNCNFYVTTFLVFETLRMQMITGRVTVYSWSNFNYEWTCKCILLK